MNRTTLIGIFSFFIIGLLLGSQLRGCRIGGKEVLLHSDTVVQFVPRTDTLWHTIAVAKNIPYKVWGHDTVLVKSLQQIKGRDTSWFTQYIMRTDTATYIDSIHEQDEFKAELYDTLFDNRIIGRSLKWANVSPIEIKTVTNKVMKKSALIKVYAGADAYGGKAGTKFNGDLAPAASLVFSDKYMFDIGYYIFNQQVTAGLKIKLSFR